MSEHLPGPLGWGEHRPERGQRPPAARALFDRRDLREWVRADGGPAAWPVVGGAITVGEGDIRTREVFGDFRLHVEFLCPLLQELGAGAQDRANSGVFLQGRYEIQVLDSSGAKRASPYGCGAIYGQVAPCVNASGPPDTWQRFDVHFRAARFARGRKVDDARVTVWHNGVLIHDDVALHGPTEGAMREEDERLGPIVLQDHKDPVRFRNIWISPPG